MKRLFQLFVIVSLQLAFLSPAPLQGQNLSFFEIYGQTNIKLPWGLYNLSLVDGTLYGCSNGLMHLGKVGNSDGLTAQLPSLVTHLVPDTILHQVDPDINYVVRNSCDSMLYYTVLRGDKKHPVNKLYSCRLKKGRSWVSRAVSLSGWKEDVNHPVFSPDGRYVVFSTASYGGLGGYDLWCSRYDGKKWGKPFNLGGRVNTKGNEVHPVFYGNYLIFASNGASAGDSSYNLYAMAFPAKENEDRMIFHRYIVQRLPEPINSPYDDWELAVAPAQKSHGQDSRMPADVGFWISTRDGQEVLYQFRGRLDGVMYQGQVKDIHGRPIVQADVQAICEGRAEAIVKTDNNGRYNLFVQPGKTYSVNAQKGGYYTYSGTLPIASADTEHLIAEKQYDIVLNSLPVGEPIVFDNVFGRDADIEMTQAGEDMLLPVALFLRENTNLEAEVTIISNASGDTLFNNMLNERRLNVLREFFNVRTSYSTHISYKNGSSSPEKGDVRLEENRLRIIFFEKDK